MWQRFVQVGFVAAALGFAACSGERGGSTDSGGRDRDAAPSPAATPEAVPTSGRDPIVVELHADDGGSYFKPNKIEAKRGDVIRFKLVTGVHNVDFLPDSNPGKAGLPVPTDMLQLPGQTVDVPVTMAPGKYYFQCDPHVALGMKGHLEVEH